MEYADRVVTNAWEQATINNVAGGLTVFGRVLLQQQVILLVRHFLVFLIQICRFFVRLVHTPRVNVQVLCGRMGAYIVCVWIVIV